MTWILGNDYDLSDSEDLRKLGEKISDAQNRTASNDLALIANSILIAYIELDHLSKVRGDIVIPERIEVTARAQALPEYERKMIAMTLLASMLNCGSLAEVMDEINGIYLSCECHAEEGTETNG